MMDFPNAALLVEYDVSHAAFRLSGMQKLRIHARRYIEQWFFSSINSHLTSSPMQSSSNEKMPASVRSEEHEPGAVWITVNRAGKHNALARPVLAELAEAVRPRARDRMPGTL